MPDLTPSNSRDKSVEDLKKTYEYVKLSSDIKRKDAAATLNELRKMKDAQMDLFRAGTLTSKQYDDITGSIEEQEQKLKRITKETSLAAKALKPITLVDKFNASSIKQVADSLGLSAKMSSKLGLSLQDLNAVGLTYWIFSVLDAQRVMNGFAASTLRNFGSFTGAAKASATQTKELFRKEFGGDIGKEKVLNMRFFTDEQRSQFVKSLFTTGVQLRNITGGTLQNIQERLLALSGAFGISIDDMVGKLYLFGDVFRLSTGAASLEIERLTSLSLKLGVAPTKFLNMVSSLTDQFKLQRIQIHEVSEVYTGFYKKLNLGVESTTALTNTTISSLAALSEGRIAAYLSITGGGTGKGLSDRLMSFYRQPSFSQKDTRLNLAQNTIKVLANKFTQVKTNDMAMARLVGKIMGIDDLNVSQKISDALSVMNDTGAHTNEAVDEARQILQETSGAEDQVMNLVTNAVFAALRFLGGIAGFFGGGAVKSMVGVALSPIESQIMKLNTQMGTSTSTYADLVGNTSVLDVIATSTTATAQFSEQAVQIAKAQVGATMAAAAVSAAAAPGPSAGAANAALAAAKGKLTQMGEAQMAPYTSVVIGISDQLKDVLKITKTVSNKSESMNVT